LKGRTRPRFSARSWSIRHSGLCLRKRRPGCGLQALL